MEKYLGESIIPILRQKHDTLVSAIQTKQNALVSGTNIKTINGQSLLGSGNIPTGNTIIEKLAVTGEWPVYTLSGSGANYDYIDLSLSESPCDNLTLRFWTDRSTNFTRAEASHVDCMVGTPTKFAVRWVQYTAFLSGDTVEFDTTQRTTWEGARSDGKVGESTLTNSSVGRVYSEDMHAIGVRFE